MSAPGLTNRPADRVVPASRRGTILAVAVGLGLLAGCGGTEGTSGTLQTAATTDGAVDVTAIETGSVATAISGAPEPDVAAWFPALDEPGTQHFVGWDVAGKYLMVTTIGSTGCLNLVLRVVRTNEQQVELSTTRSEALRLGTAPKTCLADYVPFTSSVVVPAGIVRTEPLTVVIDGTRIEVPPAS